MQDFKPIETLYKGYRFRSRIEARWAVFFESLGAKWQYEPEGYSLRNEQWYLPDFYVEKFADCPGYFEVKPDTVLEDLWIDNAEFLSEKLDDDVFILNGAPDFKTYKGFRKLDQTDAFGEREWFNVAFMHEVGGDLTEEFFKSKDLRLAEKHFQEKYQRAVYASRSARFN